MVEIPEHVRALLDKPVLVNLGTVRPDGAPQVNPMWFVWDGEFIWFTHTTYRQKYKNIAHEPRVSVSIFDPDNEYGYVEIRGVVDHIDADPEATLYQRLSERYNGKPETPGDAPQRVAVAVRPTKVLGQ
jgi:PPOX class probable F420-dependent enzyme